MKGEDKDKRILFLLKVWFYLEERNKYWPWVRAWIEEQLNREFQ